jgi:hypothetical protein
MDDGVKFEKIKPFNFKQNFVVVAKRRLGGTITRTRTISNVLDSAKQ